MMSTATSTAKMTMVASCSPLLASLASRHARRLSCPGLFPLVLPPSLPPSAAAACVFPPFPNSPYLLQQQGFVVVSESGEQHQFQESLGFLRNVESQASLNVEAAGAPASVPVRVAHELLQAGHRYLDVRTPEEFGAGHASGAINIPYMYKVGSGMSKNARFVQEVSGRFAKDDEIIVGCQSGKRSLMAARDLVAEGFTAVTDIAGGYAAWTQNGLPTES